MKFRNLTKNQHFVSQAEQRLNAIPSPAKKSRLRIYAFDVVNRDMPVLSVQDSRGALIKNSLSGYDLFSFDVVSSAFRSNLESLFHRYERDLIEHSQGLLRKLRQAGAGALNNVKADLLGLFSAKFLNFARNPHCVRKVLNTLGAVAGYRPTDPDILSIFERVLRGSRPHQQEVCQTFGLTADLYDRWLQVLFMLLVQPKGESSNLLELTIKGLFESHYTIVQVYGYAEYDPHDVCLLSDRGFNIPQDVGHLFALEFNICSRAFARFVFCDPSAYASAETRDEVISGLRARVDVDYIENDLKGLARYNQLTAYQCAGTVYAADSSPRLEP